MSELNDMTCEELADVAAELALGVLTGRERAMAVAHLTECDACREDVRQLMATGEQLLQLLPAAEPPAGFETRVLARLGLPAPSERKREAAPDDGVYPQLLAHHNGSRGHRGPAQDAEQHRTGQPAAPPGGPGRSGTRRPGRTRRMLTAAAVSLAVIGAGLGGWSVGAGTAPAAVSAAGPLTSASLLSAAHQNVGDIYLYAGKSKWMFMSVDLGSGNEAVTCELVSADGQVSTVGTFQLADGYGSWGSPDPGNIGTPTGARLVAADGTVLASATFQ